VSYNIQLFETGTQSYRAELWEVQDHGSQVPQAVATMVLGVLTGLQMHRTVPRPAIKALLGSLALYNGYPLIVDQNLHFETKKILNDLKGFLVIQTDPQPPRQSVRPLADQFEEVQERFKQATISNHGVYHVVNIPNFPIPEGWTYHHATVRFVVPADFPYQHPSGFWADSDLYLGSSTESSWPASFTTIDPRPPHGIPAGLQKFLWEPESWALTCTLRTYTGVILSRFLQTR
jgi:hypothetical protein